MSKNSKDGGRKDLALESLFWLSSFKTAGRNKYETITKLLGTSVFFWLLMISVEICIPLSKANTAF